jgi:putative selenoprotein
MTRDEKKPDSNRVTGLLGRIWNYLREVSGENDYARYCARLKKSGGIPLSARGFYLEQLERKNARPTRCC